MTNYGIGILKTAMYLPAKVNTNAEVCSNVKGLTEDWIIQKTGIKMRYHLGDMPGDLAATDIGIELSDGIFNEVGLLIVASFSQEYQFPPLSAYVHNLTGLSKDCQIMDINVNCVGLVTGTTIAVERMKADKRMKFAIVIGMEHLSKYIDPKDKFTAPFFSDGASGVLLGRVPEGKGLLKSRFATDSSVYDEVKLERGGFIYQNGKTTWTQAVTNFPYVLKELCKDAKIAMKDVDFWIFHQANKVMIDYIMDKHRIPHEKTYTNVEEIGNTGAASIGIALHEAMQKGLIKKDSLLVLAGIGAGFNFGANLWKM